MDLQLVLPLAVIHGREGDIRRIRVGICRVTVNEALCLARLARTGGIPKPDSLLLPYELQQVQLCSEVTPRIVDMSVEEDGEHTALRQKLLSYRKKDNALILNGMRAITYWNEDTGNTANSGVYYPVISHYVYRTSESKGLGIRIVRPMGYWDYRGEWYNDGRRLPYEQPYTTEWNCLVRDEYDKAFAVQTDFPTDGGAETFLGMQPTAKRLSRNRVGIVIAYNGKVAVTAAIIDTNKAAASALLGLTPDYSVVSKDGTRCFIGDEKAKPFMKVPDTVKDMSITVATKQVVIQPSIRLANLSLRTTEECVRIPGLAGMTLSSYAATYENMTSLSLPKKLRGRKYQGDFTTFSLMVKKAKEHMAEQLNLYALCSDAANVSVNIPTQVWNTIILPTSMQETVYAGGVLDTHFRCVIMPGDYTSSYDEGKYVSKPLLNRTSVLLRFLNEGACEKAAEIDTRRVTTRPHIINICVQEESDMAKQAKNVVNLHVGMAQEQQVTYTTDYGIDDNISIMGMLPCLAYTLRTMTLNKSYIRCGTTRITGNIDLLYIRVELLPRCLETAGVRYTYKDIYIDGDVQQICIQPCTKRDDASMALSMLPQVRVHLRRGTVMPKLVTLTGELTREPVLNVVFVGSTLTQKSSSTTTIDYPTELMLKVIYQDL